MHLNETRDEVECQKTISLISLTQVKWLSIALRSLSTIGPGLAKHDSMLATQSTSEPGLYSFVGHRVETHALLDNQSAPSIELFL